MTRIWEDPRDEHIDFRSVRLLLSLNGWRPSFLRAELVITADGGEVQLTYTPDVDAVWTITGPNPWGEESELMTIIVPARGPYGTVTHMAEHVRSLAGLKSRES